jgi:hypothetical protein
MARAMSSLPVPVSPVIRTVESVGATLATRANSLQSRRFAHDLLEHGCLVDLLPQRDVLFVELVPQFLDFIQEPPDLGFRALALGDVRDAPTNSNCPTRLGRMTHNPNVFDGSIRHQQPMFKIESRPFA